MPSLPYNTARFARIATKAVILSIFTTIAFDLLSLWENQQLLIIMSEDTPYSEAMSLADNVDSILFISGITLIAISIFGFIMSAIWIYRASKNAAIMEPYPGRIRPGWAVGWYFIPFANLWKPFVALKEIWNSSFSPALSPIAPATALLGFWWAAYIANHILVAGLLRMQRRTDDIELYMTINNVMLFSTVLSTFSSFLFIKIMQQISARQMAWSSNED